MEVIFIKSNAFIHHKYLKMHNHCSLCDVVVVAAPPVAGDRRSAALRLPQRRRHQRHLGQEPLCLDLRLQVSDDNADY